jgi:hypothetical protein
MYRLPSPYNANQTFSTAEQFRNPAQTIPLPQPSNMPSGCWFGNRLALDSWVDGSAYGVFKVMFWSSPIFDTQPQLRGLQPSGSSGSSTNNGVNAVPIWTNGVLHLQISNLRATKGSLTSIKLETIELGHVSDSGKMAQLLPNSDITDKINTTTDSCVLHFRPYGEGSTIRFWQLKLQFSQVRDSGEPLPKYYTDVGYY